MTGHHRLKDFEEQVLGKGGAILDEVFGVGSPERSRVAVEGPKDWATREVRFSMRFQKKEEFEEAVRKLSKWLENSNNWEKIENIMLI